MYDALRLVPAAQHRHEAAAMRTCAAATAGLCDPAWIEGTAACSTCMHAYADALSTAAAAAQPSAAANSEAHLHAMALHQLIKAPFRVRIVERVGHAVAAARLHAQPQKLLLCRSKAAVEQF